ncbi:hypothetical protein K443DRAFT_228906 [Laccaria amethystina LaAM-08-1]|uniref:Uncharacterized protein n=1 Tax=Laccaria amethystina LaAM-08-1 TaxID=1095629 RepID=A0A0C9XNT5_9AGAR|nr:hypothetical protein K443DRAFT_228906 [Laccaria amethystina LaAM-08-1]
MRRSARHPPLFSSKSRLCVICAVALDFSLFLVEVGLLGLCALYRAFALAIASCRGGREVGSSVRHRLVQGLLPGTLVSHILGAWALCPALGPHRLASFRTAPSFFFSSILLPDPTTTAPSTLYHCSWRPVSWPYRPLSPSTHQQAQQNLFAAPARSQRFRPMPIFAPANNGCYSRLSRPQPPPDAFPRSS